MWYERSALMYPLIVIALTDFARFVAIQSVIVTTVAGYGRLYRPRQNDS